MAEISAVVKKKNTFFFRVFINIYFITIGCIRLKVLNLSNNRLTELPSVEDSAKTGQSPHCLEKLYVTGNCLTDTALDSLGRLPALRVLHAAYNTLDTMPER